MSEPGSKHGGHEPDGDHEPGEGDKPDGGHDHAHGVGGHGMLVVGLESIFISHLPMLTRAHGVQLIAEVEFDGAGRYREERGRPGGPIYTLVPAEEDFSWRLLVPNGSAPPRKTSFKADIFKGHFERGGKMILAAETVNVVDVTYVHELSVAERPGRKLSYRWVGRGDERFLAHEIHGPPTFDQVLEFSFVDPALNDIVRTGAPAVVEDRPDEPEQRLRTGDTVSAHFFQSIGPEGQHGFSAEIAVTDEGYVEIDELRPPDPPER